ncbi:hypothetical protein C8035_v012399 [Colletotrichum spinosum]|uniref:Uncharacterized protein n=1 Tax=Colletotrichum spinosum TaxID=1347390 RepID=A0A4R8Q9H0_9PEZI|nr:hypothetical protein C8035_v012399 [Colletotrichum spinosum]
MWKTFLVLDKTYLASQYLQSLLNLSTMNVTTAKGISLPPEIWTEVLKLVNRETVYALIQPQFIERGANGPVLVYNEVRAKNACSELRKHFLAQANLSHTDELSSTIRPIQFRALPHANEKSTFTLAEDSRRVCLEAPYPGLGALFTQLTIFDIASLLMTPFKACLGSDCFIIDDGDFELVGWRRDFMCAVTAASGIPSGSFTSHGPFLDEHWRRTTQNWPHVHSHWTLHHIHRGLLCFVQRPRQ